MLLVVDCNYFCMNSAMTNWHHDPRNCFSNLMLLVSVLGHGYVKGSRRLRLQGFSDNRHKKVVRLSALCTGCLYRHGQSLAESTPGPQCGWKD
jgi:hypothetical protein